MDTSVETVSPDNRICQEKIILEIIKELCRDKNRLSSKLKEKVYNIMADTDLTHYSSLHKLSTTDDGTSTVLGLTNESPTELTFEEQAELNQAVIQKIQTKIPLFSTELDNINKNIINKQHAQRDTIQQLQESVNEKLNVLREQENEKIELMTQWLNHRLHDVAKFSASTSELSTLKTRILEFKSRILHLQILRHMYTETNQSVKAYNDVHKDLKEGIKETQEKISEYKKIIESDYN